MKKLIALTLVLVFILGCAQSSNYASSDAPVDKSTEIAGDVAEVDSADTDLADPELDFNLDDW